MAQYFVRSTKSAKTFPAILAAALSSCSSLHTTHQGVWVGKHTRKLKTFEIPTPGPNEILIRSERFGCGRGPTYAQILKLDVAVSSNPKDWKVSSCIHNLGAQSQTDAQRIDPDDSRRMGIDRRERCCRNCCPARRSCEGIQSW